MNKKTLYIIIIIIAAIIIGLVIYYFINKNIQNKTAQTVKQTAMDFSLNWGNYDDEASDKYLNSIKPYLSEELTADFKKDAEVLKRMQAEYGPPISSSFEVQSTNATKISNDSYLVKVTGRRQTPDLNENVEEVDSITFKKIKGNWKVVEITSQKEK